MIATTSSSIGAAIKSTTGSDMSAALRRTMSLRLTAGHTTSAVEARIKEDDNTMTTETKTISTAAIIDEATAIKDSVSEFSELIGSCHTLNNYTK
jgi:hypothetical protein